MRMVFNPHVCFFNIFSDYYSCLITVSILAFEGGELATLRKMRYWKFSTYQLYVSNGLHLIFFTKFCASFLSFPRWTSSFWSSRNSGGVSTSVSILQRPCFEELQKPMRKMQRILARWGGKWLWHVFLLNFNFFFTVYHLSRRASTRWKLYLQGMPVFWTKQSR